jgi:cell division protein FtsB
VCALAHSLGSAFLARVHRAGTVARVRARGTILWVALAAALALALRTVADARGFRRYLQLRREMGQMADRKTRLVEENRKMAEEIRALREDPDAIERAAREELGLIKPGEIVFNLE